jgi:hypothetical protein
MPDGFVRADILTRTATDARFVPGSAVMQFAGVQRIDSVKDGQVVEHRIALGPALDGWRELLEPPGVDRIIDKPRGLRAGIPAKVAD